MDSNILHAMATLAAKKDIRPQLNGILVEWSATATRIVATDGHKMGIYNLPDQDNPNIGSVIIPLEALAGLKGDVVVDWNTLTTPDSVKQFRPIDMVYPDYRRVMPRDKANGIAGQFNVDYMAQFQKVAKMLGKKDDYAVFYHNGLRESARVTVTSTPNFLGVIMPMRIDLVDDICIDTFIGVI